MANTDPEYVVLEPASSAGAPSRWPWVLGFLALLVLGVIVIFVMKEKEEPERIAKNDVNNAKMLFDEMGKASDLEPTPKPKEPPEKTSDVVTLPVAPMLKPRIMTVYFEFNSSYLSEDGTLSLNEFYSGIKGTEGSFVLEGHTCSLGPEDYNRILSEGRAKGVADRIKDLRRYDEKEISIQYYGETDPVSANDTVEGRRKNRRVEVTFNPKN